jgi:hypothetical protein
MMRVELMVIRLTLQSSTVFCLVMVQILKLMMSQNYIVAGIFARQLVVVTDLSVRLISDCVPLSLFALERSPTSSM